MAGTLDELLVRTALDLLSDGPAEGISMRQVAQQLGVSHQAPYVHFGSKRRFLAAVAGAGLQQAAAKADAALAAAGDDPAERFHALIDAYISFMRERPHLHDLANGSLVAKADHPLLQRAAIDYWNLLHDTVAACQPDGTSEAETLRRCAAAWGTVYGIARLATLGQIPTSVPGDQHRLLHDAAETLYRGWQINDPAQTRC
ncbi:MAG TPA: TetR/AcrR family transcriptional regulator [Propionibacteriaceae bacterium]|jgi:AcrR family transcriptional regulator|nr:TetR/AcrR family transcriptional regulator [Propionibacteriaceae bacterium]